MRRLSQTAAALVFAAAGLVALTASAVPITLPTGLNPGDQYRLAFVTSTTRDATSSIIADYNTFVTGVANSVPELAALGTTWTAIASTSTVDARDNTSTNPITETGYTIFLLNDTKLADNYADLWDNSIDVPFGVMETGAAVPAQPFLAYTGTFASGIGSPSACLGCTIASAGSLVVTIFHWASVINVSPTDQLRFYAMSGPLTYVPEPGTASLLSLGLIVLGVARRSN